MRRQGRWDEAIANLQRAVALDPRNGRNLLDLAYTLMIRKRYAEAEEYVDRGMIISPDEAFGAGLKMELAIGRRGNVQEAIQHLRNALGKVQPVSSRLPLLQQSTWPAIDDPALKRMLVDASYDPDQLKADFYSGKAVLFRYLGDSVRSHAYADSAITEMNNLIKLSPDPSQSYMALAVNEALRGNRAAALRTLRAATEALPESRDALNAMEREKATIGVYTLLGDADSAIPAIERFRSHSGELF
jgi:tetratricopeptide (TPR) repeat protein